MAEGWRINSDGDGDGEGEGEGEDDGRLLVVYGSVVQRRARREIGRRRLIRE